jgi:F-type H+-transporting ATPase subunit gamma
MNPLHLRNKLKSINNLYHMVHSMETLATMKISKLKQALDSRQKYTMKIEELLRKITYSFPQESKHLPFLQSSGNETKPLYIVLSSDRGFCGAMNHMIEGEAKKTLSKQTNYQCWVFGKKTSKWLSEDGFHVSRTMDLPLEKVDESYVKTFIADLMHEIDLKNVDAVYFISMQFHSSLIQKVQCKKVFPLDPSRINQSKRAQQEVENTLFLPDVATLLKMIATQYLKAMIMLTFIEAAASEQAMRMMSMKNASDSAKEMLEKVRQDYQHMRQEKITRELMELVLYESSTKNKRR